MTKKRDIIKTLKAASRKAGLSFRKHEGGSHTIITIDGLIVPVPRHREISEITTGDIYKEAAVKLGKEWWK